MANRVLEIQERLQSKYTGQGRPAAAGLLARPARSLSSRSASIAAPRRGSFPVVPGMWGRSLSVPVSFRLPREVPAVAAPSAPAAWAAATAMLLAWRDGGTMSPADAARRAGGRFPHLLQSGAALSRADLTDLVAVLGLLSEPVTTPDSDRIHHMLRTYGPVWLLAADGVAGPASGRVLVGIEGDGTPAGTRLAAINPADGSAASLGLDRAATELGQPGSGGLLAIYWPPDTVATGTPSRAFVAPAAASAAIAAAGLGWSVFQGIANNNGDIHWTTQRMEGAKHPWEQKDTYENMGTWTGKSLTVKQMITTAFDLDEVSATFELNFRHNGHSVGYVSIDNTGTNDAPFWGMQIDATIMPDPNAYRVNGVEPVASVEVTFNFRFTHSIRDDSIYIETYRLYGNGAVEQSGRWTQW